MVGDRRRPWSCSQAIVCGVSVRFPRAGVQHVAARIPWLQVQRPYPVLGPGCSLAGQGHLTQQLLCGGSTTKATVTGLARSLEQQRSRYMWARSRLACHVQKRHGAAPDTVAYTTHVGVGMVQRSGRRRTGKRLPLFVELWRYQQRIAFLHVCHTLPGPDSDKRSCF
jgi:hypothetical protein